MASILNFRMLVRLANPVHLLLAGVAYSLGAGIAHYLGRPFQVAVFVLGLLAVIAIQAASFWLVEYFRLPLTPLEKDETPRRRDAFRAVLLQSAVALLTVSGAIFLTLLLARLLPLEAGILLGIIEFSFIAYAVPPIRFSETGYGELLLAIALGTLFPALAFLLQFGGLHRLLSFVTFPLTLLALTFFLVNGFSTFATDMKFGRRTFLTRLTWQRAIPIHHMLVLAAFLFFSAAPLFGFPWGLVWPVFLAFPFALVQIIWLQRIALGGRTLWKLLKTVAIATLGLTAYLLAMTFWLR